MSVVDAFDVALAVHHAHPQAIALPELCRRLRLARTALLPMLSLLAYEHRVALTQTAEGTTLVAYLPQVQP